MIHVVVTKGRSGCKGSFVTSASQNGVETVTISGKLGIWEKLTRGVRGARIAAGDFQALRKSHFAAMRP